MQVLGQSMQQQIGKSGLICNTPFDQSSTDKSDECNRGALASKADRF